MLCRLVLACPCFCQRGFDHVFYDGPDPGPVLGAAAPSTSDAKNDRLGEATRLGGLPRTIRRKRTM
jgi:hypothetical protein